MENDKRELVSSGVLMMLGLVVIGERRVMPLEPWAIPAQDSSPWPRLSSSYSVWSPPFENPQTVLHRTGREEEPSFLLQFLERKESPHHFWKPPPSPICLPLSGASRGPVPLFSPDHHRPGTSTVAKGPDLFLFFFGWELSPFLCMAAN